MRKIRIVLLFLALIPLACCSTASTASKAATANQIQRVDQDKKRLQEQSELISHLEIRIAMLEAAVREIRADTESRDQERRTETVRIGRAPYPTEYSETISEEVEATRSKSTRPVLRLYSEKPLANRSEPLVLPEAPPSVSRNLSVVPLPPVDTPSRISAVEGQPKIDNAKYGLAEYRAALGLMRQRKFDHALQTLSGFITRFPNSPYLDSAMYWRGEVYYLRREYKQALQQFETVTTRFPSSQKLPDSLLKIGLCHKRLGDVEQARVLFLRLRNQYPKSNAARMASLEGSS